MHELKLKSKTKITRNFLCADEVVYSIQKNSIQGRWVGISPLNLNDYLVDNLKFWGGGAEEEKKKEEGIMHPLHEVAVKPLGCPALVSTL